MIKTISLIAIEAGREIIQIYNKKYSLISKYKNDLTPVTIADLVSHKIIVNKLMIFSPEIPILSEENLVDWEIRKNWNTYWLIDPLDGTKEFLYQKKEFTVNIALIKNGKPIIGVIYLPIYNILYFTCNGKSWKMNSNGSIKNIRVKERYPPKILISRFHNSNNKLLSNFLMQIEKYQIFYVGSSWKFCLIAEGIAQIYPRFSPTNIWDTAAGHAIASLAGAKITDSQGRSLKYFPKKSFLNPNFNVSCPN